MLLINKKFHNYYPVIVIAFCIMIFNSSFVIAQNANKNHGGIIGEVITSDSLPASYVIVTIVENKQSVITNKNGNFYFDKLNNGIYKLLVSGVGIADFLQTAEVNNNNVHVLLKININAKQLEEVIVKTQAQSYTIKNNSSVTRSDIPIQDIPQSIEIVSQQQLKDRQALNLN